MRGSRVKQLRGRLRQEWPFLLQKYGKELKQFNIVFRFIKKGYNEQFKLGGYKLARTKCMA